MSDTTSRQKPLQQNLLFQQCVSVKALNTRFCEHKLCTGLCFYVAANLSALRLFNLSVNDTEAIFIIRSTDMSISYHIISVAKAPLIRSIGSPQ